MLRLWWAAAPAVALLLLASPAPAQEITTSSTTTESTTTTTQLITIPTTTELPTTTTEPAVTTSLRTTSTTESTTSSSTSITEAGPVLDEVSTTSTVPFSIPTTVPEPKRHREGLSTDTVVRLVVGALLLIATVLGGITLWYWRQTDPRRRSEAGR